MCGIVGYIGKNSVQDTLIDGLRRLEYRGYDSAGMALWSNDQFWCRRSVGPVDGLEDLVQKERVSEANTGIAHTRWATHGAPNEVNAHPHIAGNVALVHNGIIENYRSLKIQLESEGVQFQSQTDTEVFAQALNLKIERATQGGANLNTDLVLQCLQKLVEEVEGHFSVLFMVSQIPGHLFGTQQGAPLVLSKSDFGNIAASDVQAILSHSSNVCFLKDGESFVMTEDATQIFSGAELGLTEYRTETIDWNPEQLAKDGYEHYMLKEIFEQPRVVSDTLSGRLPHEKGESFVWDYSEKHEQLWKNIDRIYISACGRLITQHWWQNTTLKNGPEFRLM